MAHTPKSIDTITASLTPADLKAMAKGHGLTKARMASSRTFCFDIAPVKLATGATVNRVKLTAREDGTVDLRLIEVAEHELLGGIAPADVRGALNNLLGFKL